MPFVSKKQRAFLYAEHPEIAERWAQETAKNAKLPEYAKKKKRKKARK
jgi:hypothetical protein